MKNNISINRYSFCLCSLELFLYFFAFLLVEIIYLDRPFSLAIKSILSSIIVRVFYLQIFVQIFLVFVSLKLTKNSAIVFISMIFSFLVYPLLIRGEIPSLHELFSFGILGNATPPLLIYIFSSTISIMIIKGVGLEIKK